MAVLPHGRRLDSDALKQAETDRFRQELAPTKGGIACSSLGDDFYAAAVSTQTLIQSALFYVLPPRSKDVFATEARLRVTTLAAGESIFTALYVVSDRTKATQIPGSLATFSTSATGSITYTFPRPFNIPADKTLVLGIRAQSITPQVAASTGSKVSVGRFTAGGTGLPDQIDLAALGLAGSASVPLVAWFSAQGAVLLPSG